VRRTLVRKAPPPTKGDGGSKYFLVLPGLGGLEKDWAGVTGLSGIFSGGKGLQVDYTVHPTSRPGPPGHTLEESEHAWVGPLIFQGK